MSNEMMDWLHDSYYEEGMRRTARKIYDYAYKVFFGLSKEDKEFRVNYGSKGAEQKVLEYIEQFLEGEEEE